MEHFDYDGFWKDLIERFFGPFLARALPELYADADLSQEPKFLDKEFRDLLQTSDLELHRAPHFADYLLDVPLKNGGDAWVLLHIEVQGAGGGDLPFRMAHYRSMIFDHYKREPAALAILTSPRPNERMGVYESSLYGTSIRYCYNCLDISTLNEEELLESDNPFDLALCAARRAVLSRGKERRKYRYLRELTHLLFRKGWPLGDRRDLLLFLARIIALNDETLRYEFTTMLREMEGEREMPVMTFIEKYYRDLYLDEGMKEGLERGREEGLERGLEKGLERGRHEAMLEAARRMRGRGMSIQDIQELTNLSLEDLEFGAGN